jgi:hypothetical protein
MGNAIKQPSELERRYKREGGAEEKPTTSTTAAAAVKKQVGSHGLLFEEWKKNSPTPSILAKSFFLGHKLGRFWKPIGLCQRHGDLDADFFCPFLRP